MYTSFLCGLVTQDKNSFIYTFYKVSCCRMVSYKNILMFVRKPFIKLVFHYGFH
jgi:hypothetical protein